MGSNDVRTNALLHFPPNAKEWVGWAERERCPSGEDAMGALHSDAPDFVRHLDYLH